MFSPRKEPASWEPGSNPGSAGGTKKGMVSTDSHDQAGGKKGTRGGTERKGVDVEALKSGFGPIGYEGGRRAKDSKERFVT